MHADDRRLKRASRLLRQQFRLRQEDMPSRFVCQEIEAGRSGQLKLDDLRTHFGRFDASIYVNAWWNGAALDRLVDSRHAGVVDMTVRLLPAGLWLPKTEVTFAVGGERGSIDVFAGDVTHAAVFVGEAKSEWGSIEETLRRLHIKRRLAPRIAMDTFGWRPRSVATILLMPENRTARSIADRFAATLNTTLPARGNEIRRWLRSPAGDIGGIWFLSNAAEGSASGR